MYIQYKSNPMPSTILLLNDDIRMPDSLIPYWIPQLKSQTSIAGVLTIPGIIQCKKWHVLDMILVRYRLGVQKLRFFPYMPYASTGQDRWCSTIQVSMQIDLFRNRLHWSRIHACQFPGGRDEEHEHFSLSLCVPNTWMLN